jgi:hypothetical protein
MLSTMIVGGAVVALVIIIALARSGRRHRQSQSSGRLASRRLLNTARRRTIRIASALSRLSAPRRVALACEQRVSPLRMDRCRIETTRDLWAMRPAERSAADTSTSGMGWELCRLF